MTSTLQTSLQSPARSSITRSASSVRTRGRCEPAERRLDPLEHDLATEHLHRLEQRRTDLPAGDRDSDRGLCAVELSAGRLGYLAGHLVQGVFVPVTFAVSA